MGYCYLGVMKLHSMGQNRKLNFPRETERLILKPPSPENTEKVQEAIDESFSDLHVWMKWAVNLETLLEETKINLERAESMYKKGEDFAVHAFLKDTGRFVLSSGIHPRRWDVPSFEIGYWCRTSMQGQGYVTEVVRELTTIAFGDLSANRLEIRCDSRNEKSAKVAERAGYRLEATLHSENRANDGSLRDTLVYVMLAEDYSSRS